MSLLRQLETLAAIPATEAVSGKVKEATVDLVRAVLGAAAADQYALALVPERVSRKEPDVWRMRRGIAFRDLWGDLLNLHTPRPAAPA